jgi:hypothetical protein
MFASRWRLGMLLKLEPRRRRGRVSRSAKGSVSGWVCDCVGICAAVGEGEGDEGVDDELVSKDSEFVRVLSTQRVPPEKR